MARTTLCPPDHKHGETSTCYLHHGCACDPCLEARTEYQFWRRGILAAGRDDLLDRLVDGRGVRRRLQALMAIGYSARRQGHRLGVSADQVLQWMRAERVRESTHARVDALYEQLANRPPQPETAGDRVSINRAKHQAQLAGYALPIDWVDIDTDPDFPTYLDDDIDVVAVELAISGHQVTLTREERLLVVKELHARTWYDSEIAAVCGVSYKTIERDRGILNLPGITAEQRDPALDYARALAA